MAEFKIDPHSWYKYKTLAWPVCAHCGLVALKNDPTRWCMKKGCDYKEHPDYRKKAA